MSDKDLIYKSPIVTCLNDSQWQVVEPYTVYWHENGDTHRITIPIGDVTDGASVDRCFWSVTGIIPTGIHMGAAVVHDYIYQRRGIVSGDVLEKRNPETGEWEPEPVQWSRAQCDSIFLMIMQEAGVASLKANVMYWAVRIFGWAFWNK